MYKALVRILLYTVLKRMTTAASVLSARRLGRCFLGEMRTAMWVTFTGAAAGESAVDREVKFASLACVSL